MLLLIALAGCAGQAESDGDKDGEKKSEAEKADKAPVEEPVVDESSKDPRRNPLAEPDFGAPGPMKLEPTMPNLEEKPGSRPYVAGWSKSGEEFGYCTGEGGQSCTTCEFLDRAGNMQLMTDCEGETKTPDPAKTKEIEEHVAKGEFSIPDVKWKFAEVAIVWDVLGGKPEERVAARLRVGGQVDNRVPVYSINIAEDGYATIWPEVVALDPEGERVGVVSHAHAQEGGLESFQVRILEVEQVASQAYNGAGLLRAHSKRHEDAIDLFHKAAFAWEGQKWSMYNLACALAQTDSPAVHAALVAAIERGGAEVKAKLPNDPDLESVRGEPWFTALLH